MTGGYTIGAICAPVVVVAVELTALRTGILRRGRFWVTIAITLAFRLILAFKVFDEVYLLTSGGPGTATEVLSFTLYQRFFREDKTGYGAAMSMSIIFLVCILLIFALSARRRAGTAP